MHYGNVAGIEKPISRLVQGTASYNTNEPDLVMESLDTALELGYTCFDTAQVYGAAKEKLFGEWIKSRGIRDQVVILAKGAHHSDRRRVTPEDITEDLTNTLAYMQTDYVDLLVMHRDDPNVPVGPIVEIMNEHIKAGKIRAYGGSNWTHTRVQDALDYAQAHGLVPMAVSSPNFSLAEQVQEPWENCITISGPQGAEAREYYTKTQMPLFTWSSLAGGFFSGRLNRENIDNQTDYFYTLAKQCYAYPQNWERMDRANELGQAKGLSLPQVALAYVMSQPLNIFALTFSSNRSEFEANIAALDVKLTPQEFAYLDLRADSPE